MTAINLVADEENDTLSSPAEFPLLNEKSVEIIGTEGISADSAAFLIRCTRSTKVSVGG